MASNKGVSLDVLEDFNTFWKHIVCDKNGRLNKAQVMKELYDYHQIMDAASKVYDHVTSGHISKPNTNANSVIAVADDKEHERWEECLKQEKEAWEIDRLEENDIFHVALGLRDLHQKVRKAVVTLPYDLPVGMVHEVWFYSDTNKLVDPSDGVLEGWVTDIEDAIKLLTEAK